MTRAPADWCARARSRLAEMEALVAQGRGATLVDGGGCTDPGGGIVPTTHSAREMAAMLRQQIALAGCSPPPRAPTPAIMRGGRPAPGFDAPPAGLGDPGVVSTAASIGYAVAGVALIGLAAYGGWVLWNRQ